MGSFSPLDKERFHDCNYLATPCIRDMHERLRIHSLMRIHPAAGCEGFLFGMIACTLLVVGNVEQALARQESGAQQHYEALLHTDDKLLQRDAPYDTAALLHASGTQSATLELAKVADADLELDFRSALLLASRTFAQPQVEKARSVFDEMQRRSLARPMHYARMAAACLSIGEPAPAAELNRQLPPSERLVIPALDISVVPGPAPTVMALGGTDGSWTLTRRRVDLSGKQVVIVASPGCSFSRKFLEQLKTDTELAGYARRSLLLFPKGGSLLIPAVHEWNAANPDHPFEYMYAVDEWPGLVCWQMPLFYFLQDGKVVSRIDGWQSGVTDKQVLSQYRSWLGQLDGPPSG